MQMDVSVVIAVYNAERFVAKAIESALMQEEVREVILVEDGSPDNSLQICMEYVKQDSRVKLYRHPGGANKGAGASFNLGIRKASCPFIAILGADDEFVPHRFLSARRIFEAHPDADAVYAHIGVIYHDQEYKALHLKRIATEITGLHEYADPEELLGRLLVGNRGQISLDALVVRLEILTDAYLFDASLRQGQDTDFMFRLAASHRLYGPENTEIVALRGVHSGNRVFRFEEAARFQHQLLKKCIDHKYYGCKDKSVVRIVITRYLRVFWKYRLTKNTGRTKKENCLLRVYAISPENHLALLIS